MSATESASESTFSVLPWRGGCPAAATRLTTRPRFGGRVEWRQAGLGVAQRVCRHRKSAQRPHRSRSSPVRDAKHVPQIECFGGITAPWRDSVQLALVKCPC